MSKKVQEIKRPSMFWLLTEGGRALTEWGLTFPYRKLIKQSADGDGHPVLVLPGFMASDSSTEVLREFIDDLGYTSHSWDMGRNTADLHCLEKLVSKIEKLRKAHRQKVTIIGHSLGGIFARQLAKANPDNVRQVITLGSPFRGIDQPNNVAWIYNKFVKGKQIKEMDPELFEDLPKPAPVPTTAIYSKEDGIVPWQLCIEEEDDIHQNIRIRGSHIGMSVNPTVLEVIADRLSVKEDEVWYYFKSKNMIKEMILYPS